MTALYAGALGHGDPEPRLLAFLAWKPVEDEKPRRDRPAVPVHSIEVPGAGEAVPTLQILGSGGEPLAAPSASSLQDRPAGARGHPGTKSVPALPAAYIRLVGPLHG